MIVPVFVVLCMLVYFGTRPRNPAGAGFDWVKFGIMLGGMVAMSALVGLLIAGSGDFQDRHPGWFFTLVFGGILAFVLGLTWWGLKRKQAREGVR